MLGTIVFLASRPIKNKHVDFDRSIWNFDFESGQWSDLMIDPDRSWCISAVESWQNKHKDTLHTVLTYTVTSYWRLCQSCKRFRDLWWRHMICTLQCTGVTSLQLYVIHCWITFESSLIVRSIMDIEKKNKRNTSQQGVSVLLGRDMTSRTRSYLSNQMLQKLATDRY